MIESKIESFNNGYSVVLYDDEDGYLVREIATDKLQALIALKEAVGQLVTAEMNALIQAAGAIS